MKQVNAADVEPPIKQMVLKDVPLEIVDESSEHSLVLPDLVATVPVSMEIGFKNLSGSELSDLSAEVGCSCVRILNKKMGAMSRGGLLVLKLELHPSNVGDFEQKIFIRGIRGGSKFEDLAVVKLSSEIRPLVSFQQTGFDLRKVGEGDLVLKAEAAAAWVKADFDSIVVSDENNERLAITDLGSTAGSLIFSVKLPVDKSKWPSAMSVRTHTTIEANIPFHRDIVHMIHFYDGNQLRLAPSVAVMSLQDGKWKSRILVEAPAGIGSTTPEIELLGNDEDPSTNSIYLVDVAVRKLGENRAFLTVLLKPEASKAGLVKLRVKALGEYSVDAPVVFQ